MTPKKILIIANNFNIGGVQKSLINLLNSIDYSKFEIDLLISEKGDLFQYIPDKIKIVTPPKYFEWIYFKKNNLVRTFVKSIGLNLNIFRVGFFISKGIITKNMTSSRQELFMSAKNTLHKFSKKYDIAIDYTGNYKNFLVSKVTAEKKISWVHGDYRVFNRNKEIDIDEYKSITDIVAVSETCQQVLANEFPNYKDKIEVIPNITSKEYVTNLANQTNPFNENETFKILDITRLDPNKGIELAIEACSILINKGYQIKWYILGDGPEKDKLKEEIKKYNMEKYFILLGSENNPYPYIKNADLIVHCSRFEGKSVAIDEAKLLEKPIILTNYETARDQITDGYNGMICGMTSISIYQAVELLINSPDLRNDYISNLKNFDIPVHVSLDKLYKIFEINRG